LESGNFDVSFLSVEYYRLVKGGLKFS